MENLKKLYKKDIDRKIEGVIIAGEDDFQAQELDEYIVTAEVLKYITTFFNAYKTSIEGNIAYNRDNKDIGVWISGFYGSGKSHFLKILSYLLENKEVAGKHAVDYFDEKISNQMLLADIKSAGNVSSDVILFNIESKADDTSNGEKASVLSVMEKVLNEKMGLSTKPFVAEIERNLIKINKYDEFVDTFNKDHDFKWQDVRDTISLRQDEFAETYMKVLGKSESEARSVIDATENTYQLSVSDFAKRINEYITSKGNDHHVVFLIDEIGQYIGDDTGLLLNLQTIVEELSVQCGNKAWVIVTSQEAIDEIVKVKGNDFSKIQARFATRLSLSSTHVDEVIKKRILEKNDLGYETLKPLYETKGTIIKSLLTFNKASFQLFYDNTDDFAITYPFVPYQFKLVQDVFDDIRTHGFAGISLSHGERNLLSAFKETAQQYGDKEVGVFVPFYAFYDTIERFLEGSIKRVLAHAKEATAHGDLKEMDLNVLKILFMLKNIKSIPANIENITTLYISSMDDNRLQLKTEITESLKRLERQTLIQRINEEYKFLTDEEQDINREIKKINVDPNKVTDFLKKIVFDDLFSDRKYTYKGKQFPLTLYMDSIKYSQEYEIGIRVISFSEKNMESLTALSMRDPKLLFIKLDLSDSIYEEIYNCLRINEYRRSQAGIYQDQNREDIIRAKEREAHTTESRIRDNVAEVIKTSDILMNGSVLTINSKDIKPRMYDALEMLVNDVYNKLNYINYSFTPNDIRTLFHDNGNSLLKEEKFVNQKAYDAIEEYIQEYSSMSVPITIRSVMQKFGDAPYGFSEDDVAYILTKLLKDEVIMLIYSNEPQNALSDETLNKLLQRQYFDKTIIKLRKKVSIDLINDLKNVARSGFNKLDLREDEDGMVQDFKSAVEEVLYKIAGISGNYSNGYKYNYPGKNITEETKELLEGIVKIKDTNEVFETVSSKKEIIISNVEKVESVLTFFKGTQKDQFDKARRSVEIYEANKMYADDTEDLITTVNEMTCILEKEEPYSDIHNLPELRDKLNNILEEQYERKSKPILDKIKNTIEYINNEIKTSGVDESVGTSFIDSCKKTEHNIETSNELKDILANDTFVTQLKDQFDEALDRAKIAKTPEEEKKNVTPRKNVKIESLMTKSYEINNEDDLNKLLDDLKEKLLKELKDNNNITIR